MENSNQFLGTERIGKLMQKYAIPCIISLLVGALYNIVDQIFIANASYLGSYGNAANTVVFPLTVVALAIAVMIGDGCCAFVSISLGQNEVPKAKRSVGNAVVMCLVSSIVLATLYLIFADTILAMFGGTVNAETYHHSQEYFFYITLGVPFYMFGQAMNPIIRADGNPRFAMISTLAGAVLNIILDPIFIFGFRWGMMGAAVATVIGQVVSCVLAVIFHFRLIKEIDSGWRYIRPSGSVIGKIYSIGLPAIIAQALMSVMTYGLNLILVQISENAVTAYGLYYKIQQFILFAAFGLRDAITPIVSFGYGMGSRERVKQGIKYGMLYTLIIMAAGLVLLEIFAQPFAALFGLSGETEQLCVSAMRVISLSFIFAGANVAFQGIFQALESGVQSLVISVCRQILFVLPVAWGFSLIVRNSGSTDMMWLVWLTFLIAEGLSAVIAVILMTGISRRRISTLGN